MINKVVCINESGYFNINLTYGKIYEISNERTIIDKWVTVINGIGKSETYSSKSFMTIDEYRDIRLKDLLDDKTGG